MKQQKLTKNDPTMTPERYLNPFVDYGFKKLFGTEENKDLLISLLNALIGGEDPIKDLSYKTWNASETSSAPGPTTSTYIAKHRRERNSSSRCKTAGNLSSRTGHYITPPNLFETKEI